MALSLPQGDTAMLALLFFALALPAVLLAFLFGAGLGYRRGKRNARRELLRLLRRMVEDDTPPAVAE